MRSSLRIGFNREFFPADVSQWKHWYVFFDHDMEVLIRFAALDNLLIVIKRFIDSTYAGKH
jgi:hypothetical protein